MFGFAQLIMRNKIVLLGLGAIVGFLFFGNKQEEVKPANPWSDTPVVTEVASGDKAKGSITDKVFKAADTAADYVGASEYKPSALRGKAVGGLDSASGAMKNVNRSE